MRQNGVKNHYTYTFKITFPNGSLGHINKPRMLLNQRSWLFMRTIVYTVFYTKGANVDAAAFILAGLVL